MNSFASSYVDLIALLVSVLLLLAYHWWLARKVLKNPAYTVQALTRIARTDWVEAIMRESGKELLAVQTLRNSTMAATFLASTSVLLIIGALTLSGQGDKLESTWHALNMFGGRYSELWMAKLLFILLDLFAAFFCFTMAVRVFNHVGYMVTVPEDLRHGAITPPLVATHLNRAGTFYSYGMRAYYFVVPLVFWLFGPHFLLAATVGLVVVLARIDRTPKLG